MSSALVVVRALPSSEDSFRMSRRVGLYLTLEAHRGYLLVALVLATLLALIGLLEELQDVGDGAYRTVDAIFVVAAGLPSRVIVLLPFIALLGTLFAYGELSRRSELVAMGAAGVSRRQLAWFAAIPALLWSGVAMFVDTQLAAPWYREASLVRNLRLSENANVLSGSGFWARGDNRFVNIEQLEAGVVPRGIRIYNFDASDRLISVDEAEFAHVLQGGAWQLHNLNERRFTPQTSTQPAALAQGVWTPFWGNETPLAAVPLDSLSIVELARYVNYLERTMQASRQAETVLWRRGLLPLTTIVMAMLAVPFATGSPRSGRAARRLMVGAAVGLAYFLGDRMLLNLGLFWGVPALVTALMPLSAAAVVLLVLDRKKA